MPWWLLPLLIIAFVLKNYKPKKNRQTQSKLKHQESGPINKINSDRGSLYTTIKSDKKDLYKIYKETKKSNIVDTKQKGDKYEAHICKHFEEQGYLTIPHGKLNGVEDQGIDIILKKDKEILFIQCKDWDIKNKYRINSKEIQYVRMNVRDYMQKNQVFNMYSWKILYVTSDNILDGSAKYKIREYSNEIEHKIIGI